jgi:hypothetical protein
VAKAASSSTSTWPSAPATRRKAAQGASFEALVDASFGRLGEPAVEHRLDHLQRLFLRGAKLAPGGGDLPQRRHQRLPSRRRVFFAVDPHPGGRQGTRREVGISLERRQSALRVVAVEQPQQEGMIRRGHRRLEGLRLRLLQLVIGQRHRQEAGERCVAGPLEEQCLHILGGHLSPRPTVPGHRLVRRVGGVLSQDHRGHEAHRVLLAVAELLHHLAGHVDGRVAGEDAGEAAHVVEALDLAAAPEAELHQAAASERVPDGLGGDEPEEDQRANRCEAALGHLLLRAHGAEPLHDGVDPRRHSGQVAREGHPGRRLESRAQAGHQVADRVDPGAQIGLAFSGHAALEGREQIVGEQEGDVVGGGARADEPGLGVPRRQRQEALHRPSQVVGVARVHEHVVRPTVVANVDRVHPEGTERLRHVGLEARRLDVGGEGLGGGGGNAAGAEGVEGVGQRWHGSSSGGPPYPAGRGLSPARGVESQPTLVLVQLKPPLHRRKGPLLAVGPLAQPA